MVYRYKGPARNENTKRNEALWADHVADPTISFAELGAKHGITKQRAHYLIRIKERRLNGTRQIEAC
jgi:hypothetical protein